MHNRGVDTNIATLQTVLQTYVDQVTDTLLNAEAQVTLDNYIGACQAYQNIINGAASSYSDVRGTVTKRNPDEVEAQRDSLRSELASILLRGGVELPSDNSLSYWSFGI